MTTFKEYLQLDELAGTKRLAGMTPAEAVEFIKNEFAAGRTKLRPLGKGAMAVALTNGTDVFKFWYQDSAYEKFANFCMANDSPWLPKFKSKVRTLPKFLKIGDSAKSIHYVKMELLQPFNPKSGELKLWDDPAIISQLGGGLGNYVEIEDIFRWSRASKKPRGVTKWLLSDHQKKYDIDVDLEQFMEELRPEIKDLITVVSGIAGILGEDDRIDHADRNMVMRGSQPVILDPIVNDEDIGINSLINDFLSPDNQGRIS